MRRAMDTIHHVVTDGTQLDDTSPTMTANGDSGISLAQHQPTAARASKDFDVCYFIAGPARHQLIGTWILKDMLTIVFPENHLVVSPRSTFKSMLLHIWNPEGQS